MDYTPGAMDNYPVGRYTGTNFNPGSVGTRSRQIALMSLYEAPLQMLCDSPTKYEKNDECFRFMAATPVVWDDTVGLGGCPDTYAAVARRKGGVWYASAITNADARDVDLDTSFLGEGEWTAEIFRDAVDSDVIPTNYVHEFRKVKAGEKVKLHLAPGGGFAARFSK
jgi:alpha-glucosidase